MIETLDRDPGLDCVRGQQDRCPWEMIRHPMVLLMRRSWNFCEAHAARRSLRPEHNPQFDFNWNRVVARGWNTAVSAEAYSRIACSTRERLFEEDMGIGEKISCLRAYEAAEGLRPQVNTTARFPSRAEGSPRRWYYRIAEGIHPYDDRNDYENFFAARHECVVKNATLEEFDRLIAPRTTLDQENIPLLRDMLQSDLGFLERMRGSPELGARDYRRILRWLGFRDGEATVTQRQLSIHSLAGVQESIARLAMRLSSRPIPPVRWSS